MASTDSLDSQPCTCVSDNVLVGPFEISEMVATAVVEALKAHLGPPELIFKTIPFTVIFMVMAPTYLRN
ncbi:hypothetical protein ABVK25_002638 [Lepraria finkii]|uniref:Uncharacterized protein n=1 Tax=Lepraria finkii TaxID=1340010 RepID=A0ABR4BJF6_9LECA